MGGRAIASFACHYAGPEGRHAQGSDFLMADGHAKWYRGSQVSSGSNNARQRLPPTVSVGDAGKIRANAGSFAGLGSIKHQSGNRATALVCLYRILRALGDSRIHAVQHENGLVMKGIIAT